MNTVSMQIICISSQVANKKTPDFKHFQDMILESIPLSSPSRHRVGLVNHSKAWKSFMFNRKITCSIVPEESIISCVYGRIYNNDPSKTGTHHGFDAWIGCASHHASRAHTKATRLLEKTTQWWSPGSSSIGCKMESLAPRKSTNPRNIQKRSYPRESTHCDMCWLPNCTGTFCGENHPKIYHQLKPPPRCIFFVLSIPVWKKPPFKWLGVCFAWGWL